MEFISVVLPTPGPPVITRSFEASARRTASFWLSARTDRQLLLRPRKWPGPRRCGGQGGAPDFSRAICVAIERSAWWSGARNRQGSPSTVSATMVCGRQLLGDGRLDDRGGDFEQLDRQRDELGVGQAAMAFRRGLGQGVGDAGLGAEGRVLGDPQLLGDGVGRDEADAADVARQPVGVFLHDGDGVLAVGLEDAHRP